MFGFFSSWTIYRLINQLFQLYFNGLETHLFIGEKIICGLPTKMTQTTTKGWLLLVCLIHVRNILNILMSDLKKAF